MRFVPDPKISYDASAPLIARAQAPLGLKGLAQNDAVISSQTLKINVTVTDVHQPATRIPPPRAAGNRRHAACSCADGKINGFAYCLRLAYLMWTQEEWSEMGDTDEGWRVVTALGGIG